MIRGGAGHVSGVPLVPLQLRLRARHGSRGKDPQAGSHVQVPLAGTRAFHEALIAAIGVDTDQFVQYFSISWLVQLGECSPSLSVNKNVSTLVNITS